MIDVYKRQLYKRKGLVIEPQMNGGASTTIYRSGTPTLSLAAALQAALALALDEQPQRCAHVQALHDALCAELQKRPGAVSYTHLAGGHAFFQADVLLASAPIKICLLYTSRRGPQLAEPMPFCA